jgi:hypothetical protein
VGGRNKEVRSTRLQQQRSQHSGEVDAVLAGYEDRGAPAAKELGESMVARLHHLSAAQVTKVRDEAPRRHFSAHRRLMLNSESF